MNSISTNSSTSKTNIDSLVTKINSLTTEVSTIKNSITNITNNGSGTSGYKYMSPFVMDVGIVEDKREQYGPYSVNITYSISKSISGSGVIILLHRMGFRYNSSTAYGTSGYVYALSENIILTINGISLPLNRLYEDLGNGSSRSGNFDPAYYGNAYKEYMDVYFPFSSNGITIKATAMNTDGKSKLTDYIQAQTAFYYLHN